MITVIVSDLILQKGTTDAGNLRREGGSSEYREESGEEGLGGMQKWNGMAGWRSVSQNTNSSV